MRGAAVPVEVWYFGDGIQNESERSDILEDGVPLSALPTQCVQPRSSNATAACKRQIPEPGT